MTCSIICDSKVLPSAHQLRVSQINYGTSKEWNTKYAGRVSNLGERPKWRHRRLLNFPPPMGSSMYSYTRRDSLWEKS